MTEELRDEGSEEKKADAPPSFRRPYEDAGCGLILRKPIVDPPSPKFRGPTSELAARRCTVKYLEVESGAVRPLSGT